jgi:hypothetical protein
LQLERKLVVFLLFFTTSDAGSLLGTALVLLAQFETE